MQSTGDSLSITLMATDIISSGSATILGLDADVSHVGENFTASVIVPSTIQEEYANFTVTLEIVFMATVFALDNIDSCHQGILLELYYLQIHY